MRRALLALALVALPSAAAAQVPADVRNHSLLPFIEAAQSDGYLTGFPDGTFRPDKTMTRAEFVKALIGASYGKSFRAVGTNCFADFTGDTQWFWEYACFAKARGVVKGVNGMFRGGDTVRVADAVVMAVAAWRLPTAGTSTSKEWYARAYDAIASWNELRVIDIARPSAPLKRSEAAALLEIFQSRSGSEFQPSIDQIAKGETKPSVPKPGAAASLLHIPEPIRRVLPGTPAPDSKGAAPELAGLSSWQNSGPLTLQSLQGSVTVLHFTQTGCPSCEQAMQGMRGLSVINMGRPFTLITIQVPPAPKGVDVPSFARMVTRMSVQHPVAEDASLATWRAYGSPGLPAYVLLDANGLIRGQGANEIDFGMLDKEILHLLNEIHAL